MTLFAPLFTLEVSHDYYGGPCREAAFIWGEATARALRRARLIARVRDGVLSVLHSHETADSAPSFPSDGLRFGLRLLDRNFPNFTELGFEPGETSAWYANRSAVRQLDPAQALRWTGSLLPHRLAVATRPVIVRLTNSEGQVLEARTIDSPEPTTSFDLAALAPGSYAVTEVDAAGSSSSVGYVLDLELRRASVLAVAELRIDPSFYSTPAAFQIALASRREVLQYYVVARKFAARDFDQLAVLDAGFSEEGRAEVQFEKLDASASSGNDVPPEGDDARVVLFRSKSPVARTVSGRSKIQIVRNGDVLVQHLPQPSPTQADANIVIHLSKP